MCNFEYVDRNEIQPGVYDKYTIRNKETNQIVEVSKDELKDAIATKKISVDGLHLTKNNRLELVRNIQDIDTTIQDYYDACKLLGIEPLHIVKDDNERYIATSIPTNGSNIVLPPFVSGIKAINRSQQMPQALTQSNQLDIKPMLKALASMVYDNETKKSVLDYTKNINKNLGELKGDIYRSESKLDDYGTTLQNGIEELDSLIKNTNNEQLLELKNHIEANKQDMTDAVNNMIPKVDDLVNSINKRIQDSFNKEKETRPNIYTKDEMREIVPNMDYSIYEKLIPYLETLKKLVKPTRDEIESWDEAINNNISYMGGELDAIRKKTSELLKSPLGVTVGIAAAGSGILPALALLEALTGGYSIITKNKANKEMTEFTKKIYKQPEMILDRLFCETDQDLAIMLLEYQNRKHKLSPKRWNLIHKHKEFVWFLTVLESNLNQKLKKPTEEETEMIIASYILAYKMVYGKVWIMNDTNSELVEQESNYIYNDEENIDEQHKRDIKATIIFSIMRNLLLIQKMNRKYVDMIYSHDTFSNAGITLIYDCMHQVDYTDEAGLREGAQSLRFNMHKYAEIMRKRSAASTFVNKI